MLLLFSIRIAEWPPVLEIAVHWFTVRVFRYHWFICVCVCVCVCVPLQSRVGYFIWYYYRLSTHLFIFLYSLLEKINAITVMDRLASLVTTYILSTFKNATLSFFENNFLKFWDKLLKLMRYLDWHLLCHIAKIHGIFMYSVTLAFIVERYP